MNILAIETSCDETAVSIVEITKTPHLQVQVLGNALYSQASLHEQYGGVFPNLAKREHAKNLVPLLHSALKEAGMYQQGMLPFDPTTLVALRGYLEREPELFNELAQLLTAMEQPPIDAIAVTSGPGLEPALWVGINGARALSHIWSLPVIPVNHMEGHLFSSVLIKQTATTFTIPDIAFPALALLISGGHTELILIRSWGNYERIGETRDDAVGEAFDKVARMLGLPYPGGPQISKYTQAARANGQTSDIDFPRPMLKSDDYDFSFSGLKTAVRYYLEKVPVITEDVRAAVALAFEDAAAEVLLTKTQRAIETHGAKTFIMGGGVSANIHFRTVFQGELSAKSPHLSLYLPDIALTTDNAVMIAIAGFFNRKNAAELTSLRASGGLKLNAS